MGARYSRNAGYTVSRRRQTPIRPTVRTVRRTITLGPTAAKIAGVAVLAVLAIVMMSSSSRSNTSLYEQNKLRKDMSQVSQDIEQLKLEAKRAQSLQEIQKTAIKEEMVPLDDEVPFIPLGEVAGAATSAPAP
jgi:cell division protein FtsL